MAKRPATAKKTLSAANLKALGDARLADLLMEMAGEDAGWKRRLRMELAAEVGDFVHVVGPVEVHVPVQVFRTQHAVIQAQLDAAVAQRANVGVEAVGEVRAGR